jgi:hypothetical protein
LFLVVSACPLPDIFYIFMLLTSYHQNIKKARFLF